MRVFLTGGTGLVGSHAAERLVVAGHEVVALVRPSTDPSFLRAVGARIVAGDVLDPVPEQAARIAGCDVVIHSAALVYRRAPWSTYEAVNVDGTRRVLEAAAASGVTRVLLVSSVAVYGGVPAPRDGAVGEDEWRARPIPARAVYARSKRVAEEVAWGLHDRGAVRLTTLRPVVVYGERDRLATPVLARLVRLPAIPLPGGGSAPLPVVYAGNVADAIVLSLERPESIGRAYNLVEPAAITLREMIERFARELGLAPRVVSLPSPLVTGVAALGDGLARLVPGLSSLDLGRGARLLTRGNPYDASRARRELGWTGSTPHAEALARTARWWSATARAASGSRRIGR